MGSTHVILFLSLPLGLTLLPLGRLTCCLCYTDSQRDLVTSRVI